MGRSAALLLASVVAFAGSVPASGKAKVPKKGPPLVVKKIRPRDGDALVPLAGVVAVTFSRPVDESSVTSKTLELRRLAGDAVPTTRTFQKGDRVVVLTPTVALDPATQYQTIVHAGIAAAKGGRVLANEKRATFLSDVKPATTPTLSASQFAEVASLMSEGRAFLTATVLPDGRVLLAGGMTDYTRYSVGADLFDPQDGAFHPAGGALVVPRRDQAAVAYGAGALLVGGANDAGALASSEFYDPLAAKFVAGPTTLEARDAATAVRLADGRIFVSGGFQTVAGKPYYSLTAEILDPTSGAFRYALHPPTAPRAGHTATLLPDGRVLLAGGDSQSVAPSLEVFDPTNETFTAVQSAALVRRSGHTATLLPDTGLVLLAGGGSRAPQLFDAGSLSVRGIDGSLVPSRLGAVTTVLAGGQVLVAGGLEIVGDEQYALDSMDLYRSAGNGGAAPAGVHFAEPRYGHVAATLRDGRVLIAGGVGTTTEASLSSAVIFTP